MSTTSSDDVAGSNAERWATPVFGAVMGLVFFAVLRDPPARAPPTFLPPSTLVP